MPSQTQLRWVAAAVLFTSSALNYLDRSVVSALSPTLLREFHINSQQFGYLITAFSLTYAISAPLMGLFIDRVGLKVGACVVVAAWSAVGVVTGLVSSLAGLVICRAALGIAEAGGIPATGKAVAMYLAPKDRALGGAVSQLGLTMGIVGAPLLTSWLSAGFGWRSAFVVSGLLGYVWIPIWIFAASRATPFPVEENRAPMPVREMLRDPRLVGLLVANMMAMTVYSLWTTWTTHFLVTRFQITQDHANLSYAWIPPNFATAGGLFGGWMALRLIRAGGDVVGSRLRICFAAGLFVLVTAAAPAVGSPALATAAISVSYFFVLMMSVNYYALPIDLFGPGRAAFGVSLLTSAYGLMQAFLSPVVGRWCDEFGWQPVCSVVAVLPLLSVMVLRVALRDRGEASR